MFSIRKKMLIPLLLVGVIFCTACSGKAEFDGATDGSSQETADRMSSVMEGSVEVVENLPDRDIKVPEYLRGEKEEKLYKENSNDENSDQEKNDDDFVYYLSGEEQRKMACQVAMQIEEIACHRIVAEYERYINGKYMENVL